MDINTTHFIQLVRELSTPVVVQQPIPVTIEALSSALCCTPRNVKFILRRLEEADYIHWKPGRGRGNTSELTFIKEMDEVIEKSFQELVSKDKIKEAIELIGITEANEALKERLLGSLSKQMGLHSEDKTTSGQDVLRMIQRRQLEKMDPAFIFTAFEAYLLGQICSTLITYDAKSETFLPVLAHTWEYSEDYKLWTFYLRKSVQFHHGKVMTSQDVKYTFQRLLDLNSPTLRSYKDIEQVEVKGDYCIQFKLTTPNLFFLHVLSSVHMSILPSDIDINKGLIGTGPFRISALNKDMLVLRAFEQYYGIRPLLDEIDIWFVPSHVPGERYYELPEVNGMNLAGTKSINYFASGCKYMLINFRKKGIQHHPIFRQVLRILFNQATIVRELGGNRIAPADSFLPWKSRQQDWTEPSLEQAQELLKSSGYQGESIILAYKLYTDAEDANWLKKRAAQIGLHIELQHFIQSDMNIQSMLDDMIHTADIIMAEEILEDDWQAGMINYFWNTSNYLHAFLQPEQLAVLEHELDHFSQLDKDDRAKLLDHAEDIVRSNNWILHGCHINASARLNESLLGLHTSSFGFLDISKLWVKP